MSRADLALLISGISLGVAIATFGWRVVFDIMLDVPRVKVTLKSMALLGYGDRPSDVYVVTATNRGRRSTTITSLWLTFGRPYRWWLRAAKLLPKRWRDKFFARGLMIPDEAWTALNTKLPSRLDVGEQAHVYYSHPAVHENLRERSYQQMYGSAGITSGRTRDSKPIRNPLADPRSYPGK